MPENDPIAILKTDHDRVRELFSQLEGAPDDTELIGELAALLELHTELEEELVYPAFHQAVADTDDEHLYFESIEEHGLVDVMLAETEPDELDPPILRAKLRVMQELVSSHIDKEEKQLFPLMRKLCSAEQLRELGDQLHERQAALVQDDGRAQTRESTRGTSGTIDINRASVEELRELEGIDEVRATRIVEYRDSHGVFEDWESLSQVEGISTRMIQVIADQASLGR